MDKQQQNDIRLFKKAKRRVAIVLILTYLVISIWPGAVYFLLDQPIFPRPPQFTIYYLLAMIIEMVVWMLIFFALSSGKPATRYLLIIGILAQFGFVGYLIYSVFLLPEYVLVFGLWAALEMVRNALLLWLNKWLRHAWYAKIFFDKTITVSKNDRRSQKWKTPADQQSGYQDPYDPRYDDRYTDPSAYSPRYDDRYINEYEDDRRYSNPYDQRYNPPYSTPYGTNYRDGYDQPYPNAPQYQSYNNEGYGYDEYDDEYDNGYANEYSDSYANEYDNDGYTQSGYGYSASTDYENNNRYYPPQYSQPDQFDANGYDDYVDDDPYGQQDYYNQADIQSSYLQQDVENEEAIRVQPQIPLDMEGNSLESARTRRQLEQEHRRTLSARYPRIALHIAICIFGELILFPALVHIFQNHFVSIDNTNVFALNLMFTLSILTAAIWTPVIFFLYLKQPGVKKAIYLSTFVQIIFIGFGGWMLWQFHQSETITYSNKVFLYFIGLELLRYGILFFVLKPAYNLEEIRKNNSDLNDEFDDQGNPYSNYSFEITEEDPLEDVDEDEQPLGERLKEGSVLIAKATKKGIRQFLDSSKKK